MHITKNCGAIRITAENCFAFNETSNIAWEHFSGLAPDCFSVLNTITVVIRIHRHWYVRNSNYMHAHQTKMQKELSVMTLCSVPTMPQFVIQCWSQITQLALVTHVWQFYHNMPNRHHQKILENNPGLIWLDWECTLMHAIFQADVQASLHYLSTAIYFKFTVQTKMKISTKMKKSSSLLTCPHFC